MIVLDMDIIIDFLRGDKRVSNIIFTGRQGPRLNSMEIKWMTSTSLYLDKK